MQREWNPKRQHSQFLKFSETKNSHIELLIYLLDVQWSPEHGSSLLNVIANTHVMCIYIHNS